MVPLVLTWIVFMVFPEPQAELRGLGVEAVPSKNSSKTLYIKPPERQAHHPVTMEATLPRAPMPYLQPLSSVYTKTDFSLKRISYPIRRSQFRRKFFKCGPCDVYTDPCDCPSGQPRSPSSNNLCPKVSEECCSTPQFRPVSDVRVEPSCLACYKLFLLTSLYLFTLTCVGRHHFSM